MSCGNSRSSKCNPCGPSEAAMNSIAERAAYYARLAKILEEQTQAIEEQAQAILDEIEALQTSFGGLRWSYVGDGSDVTFDITGASTTNANAYLVAIDGVIQDPINYTISIGTPYVLTMTSPVPTGSNIVIVSLYGFAQIYSGTGSPEGIVAAPLGSLYTNKSGGAGQTLWVKESGAATINGWTAK
jgi:hypothetical protein